MTAHQHSDGPPADLLAHIEADHPDLHTADLSLADARAGHGDAHPTPTRSCLNCGNAVTQERDGDPAVHADTDLERCAPDRDEFAVPDGCTYCGEEHHTREDCPILLADLLP